MPKAPPTAWIITDGKIGCRVQCIGIAKALGVKAEEKIIAPNRFWSALMPYGPLPPADHPHRATSPIRPPFPRLVLASGRRAVAYMRAIKQQAGGQTATVFLQDPKTYRYADIIWSPQHDHINKPNAITTLTAPHWIRQADLQKARRAPLAAIAKLATPRVALILGNPLASIRRESQRQFILDRLAADLQKMKMQAGSFMVTPSRRTPHRVMAQVEEIIGAPKNFIWSGKGDNPYIQILAHADALIVSGDSHNMVSEAALTGRPVLVARHQWLKPKFHYFLDALATRNVVRDFDGSLPDYHYPPLNATDEIAAFIKQKLRL